MLDYYPTVLQSNLDMIGVADANQYLFEGLWNAADRALNNQFLDTADAYGVGRWESILGIVPKDTDTLDFRKDRVRNRLNLRPPFTIRYLKSRLDDLFGAGNYTVEAEDYTLYIDAAASNLGYSQELTVLLDGILPANMVYVSRPTLGAYLLLSEGVGYGTRTFHYRLGAWGLGEHPFFTDESKENVKMPNEPSLQAALLNGTADYLMGAISKARLNGTEAVSALDKETDGSTVIVSYTANPGADITLVELLDAEDNVLTSSAVYIPVTSAVVMKHTIHAQEGVAQNG